MSSEIRGWVLEALGRLKNVAAPLSKAEARLIVANAKRIFVGGNPCAWWLNLKGPTKIYDSTNYKLEEILPSCEKDYWFIPETEEEDLPVFSLTRLEIETVLNGCPFFEYYVLDKDNQWLVAESDHNQFHVVTFRKCDDQ
jgi:hypothetical protein